MERYPEVSRIATCLLIQLLLLAVVVDSASTEFESPEYSHRTGSAKAWLKQRLKEKNVATLSSTRWSQLGQTVTLSRSEGPIVVEDFSSASDEFLRWLHKDIQSSRPQNFSIVPMEKLGFKSEDGTLVFASFGTRALSKGDTILELQLDSCLSDTATSKTTVSLQEAPWEVRLASKLLHERAKGAESKWASYIKMLPDFVFLPLFFTDLELSNIQDVSVLEEVQLMRRFIESAYQSLTIDEASGAKFKEFAWAMAIVYSSGHKVSCGGSPLHLLIPFVTSSFEPRANIQGICVDGGINLEALDEIQMNDFLSMAFETSNSIDLLVFHGLVKSTNISVQLFSSLLDLVDWYVPKFGGINNNKYLTLRVAQDAEMAFTSEHMLSLTSSERRNNTLFLLKSNSHLDPQVVCILAVLSHAKNFLASDPMMVNSNIGNMNNMEGTSWGRELIAIAKSFIGSNPLDCDSLNQIDTRFKDAAFMALDIVHNRMQDVLASFSTTIEEDKLLLAAAHWDGIGGTGSSESGCATCRWQLEELSLNDYLAVLYRVSRKIVLQEAVSQLSCFQFKKTATLDNDPQIIGEDTTEQFVSWMQGTGFSISEKLEITHLTAGDGSLVRGVVVLENMQRGETLCNLPSEIAPSQLNMGLYDNETAVPGEVDAWDRAAARLLREKAKGNSSTWASYINILPRQMIVPILLEDHELLEVQWWPVLRELVQVRKSIRESFALLSAEDLAGANFEEYRWAVLMVHSRAFTLPVIAEEHYAPYVMMPYMDMINHHYRYQADWISQPIWGGKLEIIARRDIRKGEELFASFGPRANDNLYLYYGFLLEDNPFDTAQIFNSYEDALRWFVKTWTSSCQHVKEDQKNFTLCTRREWEEHWRNAKEALDAVAGRGPDINREWWHLVNYWADIGYQYIPYQPGPTVYSKGVIDPSLIALFESVANNTRLANLSFDTIPQVKEDQPELTGNNGTSSKSLLKSFFECMKDHIKELNTRSLIAGHPCWTSFGEAYLATEFSKRLILIGKVSTGLRCLEVLSMLPTTLEEDQVLIKEQIGNKSSRTCSSGVPCSGQVSPSEHLLLTRQYRLLKKKLIQEVVHKLVS